MRIWIVIEDQYQRGSAWQRATTALGHPFDWSTTELLVRKIVLSISILVSVSLCAKGDESFRDWTSTSGNTVRAKLLKDDGWSIVLQKESGENIQISQSLLSATDRGFLEEARDHALEVQWRKRYVQGRMSRREKHTYEFEQSFMSLCEKAQAMGVQVPSLTQEERKLRRTYRRKGAYAQAGQSYEESLRARYFEVKRSIVNAGQEDKEGMARKPDYSSSQDYGSIGGTYVVAHSLGVILDESGSMQEHLPKLRKEIDEQFHSAKIVGVPDCSLTESSYTLRAMNELIEKHAVDSIYWFSDLQDSQTEDGLDQLNQLLSHNYVRLYITSVGKRPSSDLKAIAVRSSGTAKRR